MVPAEVPLYVSFDTDLESEQWQAAQDLLDRFPGRDELLNEIKRELAADDIDFERDVRPVLGPEVSVALLDLDDEDSYVVLMQPKDEAKLNALLAKGDDPPKRTEIDGWTVFAESQAVLDRFVRESDGEKLSDDSAYEDAVGELPDDALVKLYAGGPRVQAAIHQSLAGEGAPQGLARRFVEAFESFAAALTAEGDGVRLEAGAIVDSDVEIETYEPQLAESLPAGALLYVSFANLDQPTRELIETLDEAIPDFEEERRQAEQAFGFSVENDLLPVLESEGAFAIYPGKPLPAFVLALADDQRAVQVMDRVGALVELGEEGSLRQHQVEGVSVREIAFPDEGFSIFYAAIDGVFVASNLRNNVVALDEDRDKLADDPLYREAQEGLAAEGGTIAFVYGNLQAGLPYAFDFAEEEGGTVTQDVRENTEPLQSFLVSVTQDGNRFELSGFLGIE
jgi:Protein of unknown function (DUF3352)